MAGMRDIYRMTAPLGYKNGGETQVAMSEPHPSEGWWDMYHDMINSGELDPKTTFEEFIEMDFDVDIPAAAKGGMVGYALGGPAGMTEPERKSAQPVTMAQIMRDMKGDKGVTPPIGLRKLEADLFTQDPMNRLIDKGKELGRGVRDKAKTGIETLKRLGSGVMGIGQELLGAGPVEAGTFSDDLDLEIIKLESAIQSLQLEDLFGGSDNSKAITSKQNLLDYYRSLK